MTSRTPYQQLIELFRLHQQRSMFVSSAYGSELSLLESFVLVELDVDDSRSAGFIADLLKVDKSSLSRAVKKLLSGGYLLSEKKKEDRRGRRLALTAKARNFLKRHDQFNDAQLAVMTGNLSTAELSEFQLYLKTLADGVGARKSPLRAQDNPLLNEMRRLSREFGLFSGSLIGTSCSPVEWQVLSEIRYSPIPLPACELCRLLAVPANTMSQLITRLSAGKMLKRLSDTADKRRRPLLPTAEGNKVVDEIEHKASKLLEGALASLTGQELARFVELFRKYLGEGRPAEGDHLLRPEVRLLRLRSEAQLADARAFLIFNLVRLNRYLQLPEILMGKSSFNFALCEGVLTLAVFEFVPENGGLILRNYAHAAKLDEDPALEKWLDGVLLYAKRQGSFTRVLCPPHSAAAPIAAKLPSAEKRSDGWLELSSR